MSMEEVENYVEMLRVLRGEAVKLGEGLDMEALNWRPTAAETNSIYQLLTHMTGSEAWWLHEIVGGADVKRDRPAEFAAKGDDLAALKAKSDTVARRSEAVLHGLSDADLAAMRDTTQGGRSVPCSVRWCILHVVEHTARHVGHIELTRQLWHARKGV
jgi:uncharacterized damage-inducible protein DinB